MVPVSSSNLATVGYDAATHCLYIRFHTGSTYMYSDVPRYIYEELMAAPSKGEYHAANIKKSFPYQRIG